MPPPGCWNETLWGILVISSPWEECRGWEKGKWERMDVGKKRREAPQPFFVTVQALVLMPSGRKQFFNYCVSCMLCCCICYSPVSKTGHWTRALEPSVTFLLTFIDGAAGMWRIVYSEAIKIFQCIISFPPFGWLVAALLLHFRPINAQEMQLLPHDRCF